MRALRAASGAVALVLSAALAGCFNDHGLAIEVDTSQLTGKAKQVELFIATQPCVSDSSTGVDCTQLRPQNLPTHLPGTIWFRDSDSRLMADVKGQSVNFRLEPDPKSSTTILFIYVVATNDNGVVGVAKLTQVPQPSSNAQILKVALTDAGPFDGTAQVHAQIWPIGSTASPACLVVQSGTANGAPSYDFVVPQADFDCDGFPAPGKPECDANAYMATNEVQSPNCTTDALTGACMVGGQPCTDGVPSTAGECSAITSPIPTCVPQPFCSNCAKIFDPTCFFPHAEDGSHIDCTVPTAADLQTRCDDQESGEIDLSALPSDDDCDNSPQLGTVKQGAFSQTTDVNGTQMAITASGGKCSYKIAWQSGPFTPNNQPPHTIMRLQAQSGTHALLIPILFSFVVKGPGPGQGSCAITCVPSIDKTDKMFTSCTAPTTHP
jgi:hypothetical protein